eukprot:GFKZ01001942.1.p1 GENE.GFKZ01001942.1~~GFKZ01001942.1.p1  ORF type:complete len:387 (+),score=39.59 GFKZ01001942.1:284-1444(+)
MPSFTLLYSVLLALACCASAAPAQANAPRRQDLKEANIAYFVQISESTLTLLPRLLKSIWHPKNTYLIHFDKKIPEWQRTHARAVLFRKTHKYDSNVHIMESEMVTYRGISMVLNILSALQAACEKSDDWDFFINVSGSDYPLVSVRNQRALLASEDFLARNRSFFSYSEKEWWDESHEYRFDRIFTDTSLSFNESTNQVLDSYIDQPMARTHNFTFTAAEAWMILHRSYAEYILSSSVARRMLLAFSSSLEPEEHYFSTLAYNVEMFNNSVVPHALRHVVWVHNGEHSGQHPYYLDSKQPDGKTWTFWKELKKSGCFFARKFRIQDSALLDLIDSDISGIGSKPNTKSVNTYLQRVKSVVRCLAKLTSEDYGVPCFEDINQKKAL